MNLVCWCNGLEMITIMTVRIARLRTRNKPGMRVHRPKEDPFVLYKIVLSLRTSGWLLLSPHLLRCNGLFLLPRHYLLPPVLGPQSLYMKTKDPH